MIFQRILIGVDESKYTDSAVEYGFQLARAFKSAVGLVNIVEPMLMPESNDTGMMSSFMPVNLPDQELINIQNDYSKKLLDSLTAKYGTEFPITQYHEFGSPADAILSCAVKFNADLIVIGTHHRSGFDKLLMGSVSESIVADATVPVLVVPFSKTAS